MNNNSKQISFSFNLDNCSVSTEICADNKIIRSEDKSTKTVHSVYTTYINPIDILFRTIYYITRYHSANYEIEHEICFKNFTLYINIVGIEKDFIIITVLNKEKEIIINKKILMKEFLKEFIKATENLIKKETMDDFYKKCDGLLFPYSQYMNIRKYYKEHFKKKHCKFYTFKGSEFIEPFGIVINRFKTTDKPVCMNQFFFYDNSFGLLFDCSDREKYPYIRQFRKPFSFDFAYIDSSGKVIKIDENSSKNVKKEFTTDILRKFLKYPIKYVLVLPAFMCAEHNIEPGTVIEYLKE